MWSIQLVCPEDADGQSNEEEEDERPEDRHGDGGGAEPELPGGLGAPRTRAYRPCGPHSAPRGQPAYSTQVVAT